MQTEEEADAAGVGEEEVSEEAQEEVAAHFTEMGDEEEDIRR